MDKDIYTGFSILKDDYILIVEAHVCDPDDVRARIREARDIFDHSGTARVVVDTSFVNANWTGRELDQLADFAREYLEPIERIGLWRANPEPGDPFQKLVDRFAKDGVPIRLFDSLYDAKHWACA